MWIAFVIRMLTWYPYYILFGFLSKQVKEHSIREANKAYLVVEKPLRFGCWIVVCVHVVITILMAFIMGSLWAVIT